MPLSIGSRLGPYEILASIGAGGIGEVYRARDAKLGRGVAIKIFKILPETFSPKQRLRDIGDARMLAHPH